ncbi:hypothetical protein niasHS_006852 [Heterodera schachtii]|uniref:Thioredoxin domain-containing protein n=1 Tax=Heterodera schachtii TaxID=97005 RepID=A0ABD2JIK9_HETSC
MLLLGEQFPDFGADTSHGKIDSFYEWMGEESWAILFSHPADFTPVCTTELARAAQLTTEFARRQVKVIALSCDSSESHRNWTEDIAAYGNSKGNGNEKISSAADYFPFPIIADQQRLLATKFGMIDPLNSDLSGVPLTVRARLRLSLLYPASTGRNFDEILRVIDSLQLSDKFMVATPEGWKPGSACMVEPRVTDAKAKEMFAGVGGGVRPLELPSGKRYLREVNDPSAGQSEVPRSD